MPKGKENNHEPANDTPNTADPPIVLSMAQRFPAPPEVDALRQLTRSVYNAQQMRIDMDNRVRTLGATLPHWQRILADRSTGLHDLEKASVASVAKAVRTFPIWKTFLRGVKGCGPLMSAVVISEYGCPERYDTVSRMWAYAGLHVQQECIHCKRLQWLKEGDPPTGYSTPVTRNNIITCGHCSNVDFIGCAPRRRKGMRAPWNNFLRAKLNGVLGPSMLKSQRKNIAPSTYVTAYYDYRIRLEHRPCPLTPAQHRKDATAETLLDNGCTNGHMHNKAIRYMVKLFIRDLYVAWRELDNLPVRVPYHEEYLGHKAKE